MRYVYKYREKPSSRLSTRSTIGDYKSLQECQKVIKITQQLVGAQTKQMTRPPAMTI
jgi:hypothetical protein